MPKKKLLKMEPRKTYGGFNKMIDAYDKDEKECVLSMISAL